jgi:hypothetical protein
MSFEILAELTKNNLRHIRLRHIGAYLGMRWFIYKNRFCQKQNLEKSKFWPPAFAGMTIFSAAPQFLYAL